MPKELFLSTIIDRHYNTPAVIDCNGPSSNFYRVDIDRLHEKKRIIKLVPNEWYSFRHSTVPDYWVISNTQFTIRSQIDQFNKWLVPVFWASSLDPTPIDFVKERLQPDYLAYRQGGIGGDGTEAYRGCTYNNFHHDDPKTARTIQEFLRDLSGHTDNYSTGITVAHHMIAFALIMGCHPIFLSGVDLRYDEPGAVNGYAQVRKGAELPLPTSTTWESQKDILMRDMQILNESANLMEREIINLNKDAWFDQFKKGDLTI